MVAQMVSFTRHFPQRSPFSEGAPHLGQNPEVRGIVSESVYLCVGNVANHNAALFVDESCGDGEFTYAFSDNVGIGCEGESGEDFGFGGRNTAVKAGVDDDVAGRAGKSGIEKFAVTDCDDLTLSRDIVDFKIHFLMYV